MAEIEVGQLWRHKKIRSVYVVEHTDAKVQISTISNQAAEAIGLDLEAQSWIAYRSSGGDLFFRMRAEFLDGRFEKVA